ncbi:aminotransferase [Thioclava kandeliae]|uniref:Aminotransferase n=1 Tax=Thioclava kandeliae TaxID=3070818 RepID=A0ABV1SLL2_9RHOB
MAPTQLTKTAQQARQHLMVPAQDMKTLGQRALPALSHGEGIHVFTENGHRLIDGPAGMWCTQVGYGCSEIAEAIADQATTLSYNSPWYTTNTQAAALAEQIATMTPGDLNRIFFTTGGSTAVDTALRFVEYFNNALGRPSKKGIVVRRDGYHGSTALTFSCSGRSQTAPHFDPPAQRIHYLSSPNIRLSGGQTEAQFLETLVEEFETLIEANGPETIGAFLAEPILASGGVIIPPKGYHARFKEICEKHEILYISDEVVTAFGRCGEWFASEKVFGVVPDIITFAKGVTSGYVPLGGVAISDKLLARVSGENAGGAYFGNGYTYSGHPVSCAAGLANIKVFEKLDLLNHVRKISGYFNQALQGLRDLPGVVDVRVSGLVGCVECMTVDQRIIAKAEDRAMATEIDTLCFEMGLIVRPLANLCVISPPLTITEDQIDEICDILRTAIIRVTAEHLAA